MALKHPNDLEAGLFYEWATDVESRLDQLEQQPATQIADLERRVAALEQPTTEAERPTTTTTDPPAERAPVVVPAKA